MTEGKVVATRRVRRAVDFPCAFESPIAGTKPCSEKSLLFIGKADRTEPLLPYCKHHAYDTVQEDPDKYVGAKKIVMEQSEDGTVISQEIL